MSQTTKLLLYVLAGSTWPTLSLSLTLYAYSKCAGIYLPIFSDADASILLSSVEGRLGRRLVLQDAI